MEVRCPVEIVETAVRKLKKFIRMRSLLLM